MKVQLLPSSIDENGLASARQHLLCMMIDDMVAIDAGCLAMACTDLQRSQVRDIILSHTHLDHIAGLPMFIDDLFATLHEPVRVHATAAMIDVLLQDIFNWSIYPRFSELNNEYGPVLEFCEFESGSTIEVRHLRVRSVEVNHPTAANGFVVSSPEGSIGITGDTAETDEFWELCNETEDLRAVFVECAFPDELVELARVSEHLTPARLAGELKKLNHEDIPVYLINLKPMYRETIAAQVSAAELKGVEILELGRVYEI